MNTSNITNYKPKDFAELLGVSVKTLQRWDREGTLKANQPQLIDVIILTTNIFNYSLAGCMDFVSIKNK